MRSTVLSAGHIEGLQPEAPVLRRTTARELVLVRRDRTSPITHPAGTEHHQGYPLGLPEQPQSLCPQGGVAHAWARASPFFRPAAKRHTFFALPRRHGICRDRTALVVRLRLRSEGSSWLMGHQLGRPTGEQIPANLDHGSSPSTRLEIRNAAAHTARQQPQGRRINTISSPCAKANSSMTGGRSPRGSGVCTTLPKVHRGCVVIGRRQRRRKRCSAARISACLSPYLPQRRVKSARARSSEL